MTDTEFERCIRRFRGSVCAAALCYLKNPADADDIVQDTFLKLYLYKGSFNDDEHIRAWLLRCAINGCKNLLRSHWYRFSEPLSGIESLEAPHTGGTGSLLPLIMKLGRNNRVTLYMYYYEDYSTAEIARILGIEPSAVTSRLERGRKQLKKLLAEERSVNDELQGYFQ